jgi:hypothetical protein
MGGMMQKPVRTGIDGLTGAKQVLLRRWRRTDGDVMAKLERPTSPFRATYFLQCRWTLARMEFAIWRYGFSAMSCVCRTFAAA